MPLKQSAPALPAEQRKRFESVFKLEKSMKRSAAQLRGAQAQRRKLISGIFDGAFAARVPAKNGATGQLCLWMWRSRQTCSTRSGRFPTTACTR